MTDKQETWRAEMTMPGFTAESSVYVTQNQYLTGLQGWGLNNRVALAGTCTCSDPGCTFSCPSPPPPPLDPCRDVCRGGDSPACCSCQGCSYDSVSRRCVFC